MADPVRLFEVEIDDQPQKPPGAQQQGQAGHDVATHMLLMALKALSQRAVIALESCFVLITVGFVFYATLAILPTPNIYQLVGLGIFSIFVLIANFLVLRRRG